LAYYEGNMTDLSNYCDTLKCACKLDRDKERELAERIQAGDEQALNELVVANLKYVITIAKRFAWSGIPLYDLISEGNLGLIKAARKFDPNRGTKFITCAKPWVTQAIDDFVKAQNTDKEFSSLDDYVFERRFDDELINTEFEEDIVGVNDKREAVADLLKCLTKRERRVLAAYFGLDGESEMSLSEIGKELGLTQERVRQIKDTCIEKMQLMAMGDKSYEEYKKLYN
jgi:RNA polymerase sigma factor, sigma-70 family